MQLGQNLYCAVQLENLSKSDHARLATRLHRSSVTHHIEGKCSSNPLRRSMASHSPLSHPIKFQLLKVIQNKAYACGRIVHIIHFHVLLVELLICGYTCWWWDVLVAGLELRWRYEEFLLVAVKTAVRVHPQMESKANWRSPHSRKQYRR